MTRWACKRHNTTAQARVRLHTRHAVLAINCNTDNARPLPLRSGSVVLFLGLAALFPLSPVRFAGIMEADAPVSLGAVVVAPSDAPAPVAADVAPADHSASDSPLYDITAPFAPPLAPPGLVFGPPVTVCKAADRYFLWDAADVSRLRQRGRMAVTAVGACPTKTATRGKAAALPVLLNDEEVSALVGAGWARVVDAMGATVDDVPEVLAAIVAEDPCGVRAQRRLVFRDLWTRGYCLTNGIKFGCDFLCYRADPTAVHAAFMVSVVREGSGVKPLNLTAVARVATTALKIAVVAWADTLAGTVRYAAFKRMGPGSAIFRDDIARLNNGVLFAEGGAEGGEGGGVDTSGGAGVGAGEGGAGVGPGEGGPGGAATAADEIME